MKLILYALRTGISNKLLFLVHFITIVVVSYAVFQYYGAYYGTLQNEAYTGEYTVRVNFYDTVSAEKIEECSSVTGFVYETVYSDAAIEFSEYDTYQCISIIGTPSYNMHIDGGELKENSVYIPYTLTLTHKLKVGEKITLDNVQYDIAGTWGQLEYFLMPIKTLTEKYSVRNMTVFLNAEELSDEQYQDSLSRLDEILGSSAIIQADDFDEKFQSDLMGRKIEAVFLFLLGTVCIVFVYSFILSKRARRFSVCSICGASKRTVVSMIAIDAFLTFTFGFIVAALLGKVINTAIFEPSFGYDTYMLSFRDFLLFYFIMLVIYIVVITIFSGKFIANTAISNYRRSE